MLTAISTTSTFKIIQNYEINIRYFNIAICGQGLPANG